MQSNDYNCDLSQGFNFEKDKQTLVGHLVSLSIGGVEYPADLTVADPTGDKDARVKVVGVISSISWEGGYAHGVRIWANVSVVNKASLATALHTQLINMEVDFKFNVYDYDQEAKTYFKAFHTDDTVLKGLLQKSVGSGKLEIDISNFEGTEVPSPKNFPFYIGIMPQDEEQAMQVAISNESKFAKAWGVTVAA